MGDHIRVGLWGAEERFRRMLNLFFKAQPTERFVVSELAEADLAIVDMDGFDAERQWHAFREQYGNLPALILSVSERRYPGAVSVLKPVQTVELLAALERLRPLARRVSDGAAAQRPQGLRHPNGHRRPQTGSVFDAARKLGGAEAQPQSACVTLDETTFQRARIDEFPYYPPGEHLQGIVTQAIEEARRTAQTVIVRGLGQDIVFFHRGSQAFTNLSDPQLCALCHIRYDKQFTPHLFLRGEGFNPPLDHANVQPSEAFLWKVTLWSARGRVPEGVDLDDCVRLTRWPNLTRWLRQPHDMQLAALWHQHGLSPRELGARFGIHSGYVNTFLSGCLALGLVESAERGAWPRAATAGERHAKQGFLRRFVAFLRKRAG